MASDSVPNISDKLFWELYGLKQGKSNLFTHMLRGSKEGGHLFLWINVFHPLLATVGVKDGAFGLKGGVTVIPLISS